MDTTPWPQEIVLKPMEDIFPGTNTNTTAYNNNTTAYNNNTNNSTAAACSSSISLPTNYTNLNTTTAAAEKPPSSSQPSTPSERKVRPQKDEAINCPRCNSTNTKFCYYNNYSLAQPRYFCKTCRRYWTAGGSLRNIPVGGGSRKNKRSSPSPIITSSKIKLPDLVVAPPNFSSSNPNPNNSSTSTTTNTTAAAAGKFFHQHHQEGHLAHDLNLGFPATLSEFMNLPNIETTSTTDKNSSHMSALELLTGLTTSANRTSFNSFMPNIQMISSTSSDPYSTTGFSLQGAVPGHHFKPTLGFSLGYDGNGTEHHHMQDGNGRMLFPFQDLNSISNNNNNSTEESASARITTSTTTATTSSAAVGGHQNYSHVHDDDQQIGKDPHLHHHQGSSTTGYWSGMLGGAGSW